jgi:flavin-dependent thymidylate synthase
MESKGSKEIQKWADPAMFAAEPLRAADGPKVYLLSMSPDPLGQIAAACKMYKGEVVRDLASITDSERREYFNQVQKTKLQAPCEFVDFHFMVEGVTRSFTHQMVRQRTAVYAQESLRFAVKEDMAEGVALPPSLAGTTGVWRKHQLDVEEKYKGWGTDTRSSELSALDDLMVRESVEENRRWKWDLAMEEVESTYALLVDSGMPAEDARGLLPHNITTRLHYKTNLRALLDHAGNRLCTQAQFEWRAVFARIIEAIRDYGGKPADGKYYNCPGISPAGNPFREAKHVGWQLELLSTIFKPICYQTGKCEFKADFDRKCKIRNRVDANHDIGRSSEIWHREYDVVDPIEIVSGAGPQSVIRDGTRPVFIGSIQPVEWIADPGAAR